MGEETKESGEVAESTEIVELLKMDGKKIRQTISNCVIAVAEDKLLKGHLMYNELTGYVELIGCFPWNRQSLRLSDNDINQIRIRFDSLYGLTSEKGIPRAIDAVAHNNPYHPIKIKLESLKWDGKPRIRHVLKKFFGVPETDYSYESMKVFMMGALERIYDPGCKFELMLCISGPQGIGKSTFFRFLALDDMWFTDDIRRLDKDSIYEQLAGKWFIEFSEMLAAANAKSIEEIKSFISRQKDVYRAPYARFSEDRYRQCVFCGTTNSMDFLPLDRTGNRRFLPILAEAEEMECHILDNEKESRAYIEQMWAEALQIYWKGNYSLTLPKELMKEAEDIQKEFMQEDTDAGIVQAWLDHTNENYVCTRMIWDKAFNRIDEPRNWDLRKITDIMNNSIEGWQRCNSTQNKHLFSGKYGRQRAWERVPESGTESGFVPVNDDEELPFL